MYQKKMISPSLQNKSQDKLNEHTYTKVKGIQREAFEAFFNILNIMVRVSNYNANTYILNKHANMSPAKHLTNSHMRTTI